MKHVTATCAIAALALSLATQASPVAAAVPSCRADRLTLRLEGGDGRFAGMSQNGVIAIVRNVGDAACSLPALPPLTMADAARAIVARGTPRSARFMHPGPVVVPIELDPGAIAAAQLHWIAGDVFAPGRKADAATLALRLGSRSISTPLRATLWSKSVPVTFDQTRFTTALPPLSPPAPSSPGTYVGEGPQGSTYLYGDEPARRLVLRRGNDGSIDFRFDGLGARTTAPSQGSISGVLIGRGDHATFHDAVQNCSLDVRFFGSQVTVEQKGDCGFGHGVKATGQYRET